MTSPAQSIGQLVEPLVSAAGLVLWDVEANPRVVRVFVDRPGGGVDLDALSDLAKVVSTALDGHGSPAPGGRYDLEVSSPGVERILRTPSHFQRYLGSEISVKTHEPVDGARRLQGTLLDADAAGITLGLGGGPTDLRYDQIQKARTVLVWGPQARTGVAKSGAIRTKDLAR